MTLCLQSPWQSIDDDDDDDDDVQLTCIRLPRSTVKRASKQHDKHVHNTCFDCLIKLKQTVSNNHGKICVKCAVNNELK